MRDEVLKYLKNEPRFRERQAKWRGIADLLIDKYHLEIERTRLADILVDGSNADRFWRDILKENPDLQGTDYKDKRMLEEEKMLSLGYLPKYHQDVQQLKML